MPEKIYIQENELRSLLDDENTIEETLKKYFVLDDSQAFKMHYKLKENVELEQDPYAPMGFIRSALIVSSNFVMRRLRNAAYRRSIRDYPERTRIVSEGDSWFQHPMLYDVIDNLSNHYSVKSLGAASDDMEDYIRDAEYLDEIRNEDPSFFLFSGGGNDIFAKGFDSFLNECTDDVHNIGAKRFVKRCLYDKLDHLMKLYELLFREITSRFPKLTLLVHGYDYVRPQKKGRWIGKHMEDKDITNNDDKLGIIKIIIEEFNDRLSALAEKYNNVEYIKLLNIVKNEWYDEIHPTEVGFQLAALEFIHKITEIENRNLL